MPIKISLTIRELFDKANDISDACEVVGLNEWCINEGLATGDELVTLTIEQANKLGISLNNKKEN